MGLAFGQRSSPAGAVVWWVWRSGSGLLLLGRLSGGFVVRAAVFSCWGGCLVGLAFGQRSSPAGEDTSKPYNPAGTIIEEYKRDAEVKFISLNIVWAWDTGHLGERTLGRNKMADTWATKIFAQVSFNSPKCH